MLSQLLEEVIMRPLLKRPNLGPRNLDNYRPVSNIPFLAKVIKRVVSKEWFLDDTDCADPSQSGFSLGYSTETALVTLVDDMRLDLDRGSTTLLILSLPSLSGL